MKLVISENKMGLNLAGGYNLKTLLNLRQKHHDDDDENDNNSKNITRVHMDVWVATSQQERFTGH